MRRRNVAAPQQSSLGTSFDSQVRGPARPDGDSGVAGAVLAKCLDVRAERIAILDQRGFVLFANSAWRKRQPAKETVSYLQRCETPALAAVVKRVLAGRSRHASVRYGVLERLARRHYRAHVMRIEHDGLACFLVVHQDITETESIRRAFVALADQLTNLQEQERQRIARELHDSTAQHLAIVALELGRLKRVSTFDAAGEEIVAGIGALLHQAQDELRTFTYLLHPPELDEQGFKWAVERMVAGFSDRAGLAFVCRVDAAVERASDEAKRAIFRVLQEALTNVYRHARARRIFVLVRADDEIVRLYIRDDGRGPFAPNTPDGRGRMTFGVGVLGMQARMHLIGGTVDIRGGRRGGTIVEASAPLRAQEETPEVIDMADAASRRTTPDDATICGPSRPAAVAVRQRG